MQSILLVLMTLGLLGVEYIAVKKINAATTLRDILFYGIVGAFVMVLFFVGIMSLDKVG